MMCGSAGNITWELMELRSELAQRNWNFLYMSLSWVLVQVNKVLKMPAQSAVSASNGVFWSTTTAWPERPVKDPTSVITFALLSKLIIFSNKKFDQSYSAFSVIFFFLEK
jgi:hypothetical protein